MHGDGVKDVAYLVEDARAIFEKAISRGAKQYQPMMEHKDENGTILMGSVHTYGDTVHSFI